MKAVAVLNLYSTIHIECYLVIEDTCVVDILV